MEITRTSMLELLNDGITKTGLNPNALERAAELKQGTIKDVYRGKTEILRADKLQRIINVLIEHGYEVPVLWAPSQQLRAIPIVGDCPGGPLMEAIHHPSNGFLYFPTRKRTLFAVRLRGNSFNRITPDGAYAIADASQTDPNMLINQPVVVGINRGGIWESTCKILKRDARGEAYFMPHSTEPHDPIFPGGDEWCIYGRVINSIGFVGSAAGDLTEVPLLEHMAQPDK